MIADSGSGGSRVAFDPMDFRMQRLEADVSEVEGGVKAMRSDMNSLMSDQS